MTSTLLLELLLQGNEPFACAESVFDAEERHYNTAFIDKKTKLRIQIFTKMKIIFINLFIASCIFLSCKSGTKSHMEDTKADIQKLEINLSESCNYSGHKANGDDTKEFYTFKSDNEAIRAMSMIMRLTGLPANFELIATDVDNAAAVIRNNKRYILYGQTFMEEAKIKTKSDFGALSILAHEIGHHLSGHTLMEGGSRPVLELEADRFSGFILAKLGASIDEACRAINIYGSENESSSHPSKKSRIAAIINGWKEGSESNTIQKTPELVSPEYENKKYLINTVGGYIVIRNRSLSPDEIRIANSATKQAKSINEETIITKVYNGTPIEVLSTTGNTFYIKTIIDGKSVTGFIAKKVRGILSIKETEK